MPAGHPGHHSENQRLQGLGQAFVRHVRRRIHRQFLRFQSVQKTDHNLHCDIGVAL